MCPEGQKDVVSEPLEHLQGIFGTLLFRLMTYTWLIRVYFIVRTQFYNYWITVRYSSSREWKGWTNDYKNVPGVQINKYLLVRLFWNTQIFWLINYKLQKYIHLSVMYTRTCKLNFKLNFIFQGIKLQTVDNWQSQVAFMYSAFTGKH